MPAGVGDNGAPSPLLLPDRMRALSLIGLVLALAVVGLLVKKQLGAVAPPTAASAPASPAPTVREQSQQIQQQVKQQLDAAMSQPRPLPDDAR